MADPANAKIPKIIITTQKAPERDIDDEICAIIFKMTDSKVKNADIGATTSTFVREFKESPFNTDLAPFSKEFKSYPKDVVHPSPSLQNPRTPKEYSPS